MIGDRLTEEKKVYIEKIARYILATNNTIPVTAKVFGRGRETVRRYMAYYLPLFNEDLGEKLAEYMRVNYDKKKKTHAPQRLAIKQNTIDKIYDYLYKTISNTKAEFIQLTTADIKEGAGVGTNAVFRYRDIILNNPSCPFEKVETKRGSRTEYLYRMKSVKRKDDL